MIVIWSSLLRRLQPYLNPIITIIASIFGPNHKNYCNHMWSIPIWFFLINYLGWNIWIWWHFAGTRFPIQRMIRPEDDLTHHSSSKIKCNIFLLKIHYDYYDILGLSLEVSMREKQNIIMICGAMIQKVKNGPKFMALVKNHPQEDAILLSV